MARYVSFRFDDGYIEGARKAAACLQPSPASFFIVTGLVCGTRRLDQIELFKGGNFGSLDDWHRLSSQGHDIQPHSISHANFTELSTEQQRAEIEGSLAVVRGIHPGPYVFGFPYNAIPTIDLASLGLSAAGFVTVASDRSVVFNRLDDHQSDLFRLRSWAVRERHFDIITDQFGALPDQSWTILAFHSLDGEGHEPWSSAQFARLVDFVRTSGVEIVSIRTMIEALRRRPPPTSRP